MATITRFEDIQAWQKARELTRSVYQATNRPAFRLDWPLRDQIRRAAVSVMSNIAEGFERGGDREFIQFLSIAKGSTGEIRAQLYVAYDAGYLAQQDFQTLQDAALGTGSLIGGFMKYLLVSRKGGVKFK